MRFTIKRYLGQERDVKRFALFPVRIGRIIRWLEMVEYKEQFLSTGWKKKWFLDI